MRHKARPKLYLKFRQRDGKQSPYHPAVFDKKSRIRPFWCLVKGTEEYHPEATYYRRFKRDGKWAWESLGTDFMAAWSKAIADTKLTTTEDVLGLKANKPDAAPPADKDPGFRLDQEVRVYLSNVAKLAPKTHKAYKRSLELFQESCKKIYVHQISKQDLQKFDTDLMQQGNEDRTRHNRVQHVVTFLKNKEGRRLGPPITDVSITVKYVEDPPEAYNQLDLYKTCVLYVDDGFKSLLTDKGSGVQSAVIIGLFSYYTKHVNAVTSALLCIEEPELYLHPHARRLISDRLTDFIGDKNQVIITTHSAEFLRTSGEDVNVIAISKEQNGHTTSTSVNLKDYARILVHEFSSEMFFAEKVVVCEGYDDFVLRSVAKEIFPKQLDAQNISVISAAGKDNFSNIVQLVMKLGIKCHILADFDYLLRDKSEDRRNYGDVSPHESIVSLSPDFFSQECIYGKDGASIYKKLQRLREKLKASDPKAFYVAKKSDDVAIEGVDLSDALTKLTPTDFNESTARRPKLSPGPTIAATE